MAQRVFNIPASAPFLPTLIEALHEGKLGFDFADDPLAFSSATLYLPTRRACRLMREAFLDRLRGDGAILPRIVAIGDIDEDEIAFAESAAGGIAADALALPPAMGSLERRLLLTRLVMTWSQSQQVRDEGGTPLVAQTPAAASALAFARALGDFGITIMIAGNIPGRTQTMAVAIYDAVESGNGALARILVLIVSGVALLILALANRLSPNPFGTRRPV